MALETLLKAAIRWAEPSAGAAPLHGLLGLHYEQLEEYGAAQQHLLRSGDPKGFAAMVATWTVHLHPTEHDLVLTRIVLQCVSLCETTQSIQILVSSKLRGR